MKNNSKKIDQWTRHIRLGAEHPDGISAYCKENGLTPSAFRYWKLKLSPVSKSLVVSEESKFIPVSVTPRANNLPDPEWMGRVLGEFMRSLR